VLTIGYVLVGLARYINAALEPISRVMVCVVLGGVGGCAASRAVQVQPVESLGMPELDGSVSGGVAARFWVSWPRLLDDVPRAMKKSHWGLVRVDIQGKEGDAQAVPLRAQALLPDGRIAHVFALSELPGQQVVAVRVGHFGDTKQQGYFLKTLGRVLRDKPKKKRGWGFDLGGIFDMLTTQNPRALSEE